VAIRHHPRVKALLPFLLGLLAVAPARAQTTTPEPRFSVDLPKVAGQAPRPAVVVLPGGGYKTLALDHEGRQIAAWLNQRGIAAFVLEYRLTPNHHPAQLQDAQRTLRLVRAGAKRYGIDPTRIGVWGFSAGGHLASMTATLFDDGDPKAVDPVQRVSSRPDFVILAYPVILMEPPSNHGGSRRNLLGDNPTAAQVAEVSTVRRVSARTPPTFLFHTGEDKVVAENSLVFYLALREFKVPAELHIFEKGAHGQGLATADPILSRWPLLLEGWLRGRGILP
jgi:acetyl esterase/lipase